MNARLVMFLCATTLLLTGCIRSPIDAKKNRTSGSVSSISKSTTHLTDKDIFGNETTLSVSEEDIQAAMGSEGKYYQISTFSGIPDKQKTTSCNKPAKNKEPDADVSENMNYMQALRYIAAKGHQKAVIVYWDTLQIGRYDTAAKATVWSDYRNETLSGSASLRYLVRFALVDVASGEWATWSPINYEYSILKPLSGETPVTEQQIIQLRQKTYAAVTKDLVNRYQ